MKSLKFKTSHSAVLSVVLLANISVAQANSGTVNDDYVGQDNGSFENTDDYTAERFDISSMDYSNDGTSVTFTIRSAEHVTGFGLQSYFDEWVNDDTSFKPGDLFLSTDGWSPFTNGNETQPGYGFDAFDEFNQSSNGTDWEYVIHLIGQTTGPFNDPASSGTTQLYNLADGGEIDRGSIRGSQEALYSPESFDGDNTNPLGAGAWNIFDANNNGTFDSMSITMLLSDGFQDVWRESVVNGGEMGFHWTMSCANDIIEGSFETPVPAAAYLFGTGLIGLIAVARRKV